MATEKLSKIFLWSSLLITLYFSGVLATIDYRHQKDMELMSQDYEKQIETMEKINECEKLKEIVEGG